MKYIIVTGSRNAKYGFWRERIKDAIEEHAGDDPYILIHGGAKGIDGIADYVAQNELIPPSDTKVYLPDWKKLGRKAGPLRNEAMASFAANAVTEGHTAVCLAFHDAFHERTGTADMIRAAKRHGIPVHTYFEENH